MAELSNNLLVVAIFAYVAAMMAYGAEWAFSPRTLVSRVATRSRELVGAGGPTVVDGASPAGDVEVVTRLRPPGSLDAQVGRSALFGRIAVGLTVLGVLAHAGTAATRAAAAGRVPWGNMYEFVIAVCLVGVLSWLVLLTRRSEARPVGLFVTLDGYFVDGLVHISELGRDYFQHDAAHHALIGERTGKRFRLADRMSVKLVRVDLDQRKIDLVPA